MADYIERDVAIETLTQMHWHDADGYPIDDYDEKRKYAEDWINSIPSADVVSKAAYDQVAWERHLAEVQLKSIGKSIGEKMDDVVPVKWIPVTERLPSKIGRYLVKVGAPYNPIRIASYEPRDWGDENQTLWLMHGDWYCYNWFVEYWMPLPEPPKGTGND